MIDIILKLKYTISSVLILIVLGTITYIETKKTVLIMAFLTVAIIGTIIAVFIDYEKLKNNKCLLCGKITIGKTTCSHCKKRINILSKEIEFKDLKTYTEIHKLQEDLMREIIETNSNFVIEENTIKLMSTNTYLKEKYADNNEAVIQFLRDIKNQIPKSELKEKYTISDKKEEPKETPKTENKTTATIDQTFQPQNDYRKKYPANFRCKSGQYVRSKSEREIADFFFDNNIKNIYEHSYVHPKTGKMASTDFFLPDYNLYLEYFGKSDPKYLQVKKEKIDMYRSDRSINFEFISFEDDNIIYDKLKAICRKYKIQTK